MMFQKPGAIDYVDLRRRSAVAAYREKIVMNAEWTIGEGECERCHAYVPQLIRCRECRTPWLCDECAEDHECG
jgi:hypothetical protein